MQTTLMHVPYSHTLVNTTTRRACSAAWRWVPPEAWGKVAWGGAQLVPLSRPVARRYIYWPHYDGDPTSYWARMGAMFIGGPQVINTSGMPGVLRSPYMFARKVEPSVDAEAVRLWDGWMAAKHLMCSLIMRIRMMRSSMPVRCYKRSLLAS